VTILSPPPSLPPRHRARPGRVVGLAIVACALATRPAPAAPEAWTDPALPHAAGLMLWLDATRIAADDTDPAADGAAPRVRIWRDGSGHRRDALQPDATVRPLLIGAPSDAGPASAVRFDGSATHLLASGPTDEVPEWTLVAVVRPRSNRGGYRAFAAGQARGGNDYTSGFNVDLGPAATARFEMLNAEGAGFVGVADLSDASHAFGTAHVIGLATAAGPGGVTARVDGAVAGRRDRGAGAARFERLVIGARSYDNSGKPPEITGFLDGDVAELLLFATRLPDDVLSRLEEWLARKHARLLAEPPDSTAGQPLERVTVETARLFIPGFTIDPLPLELTNVNCLGYRHDGVLVAGAYDGRVLLLSDTDGDGLEDSAREYFRSPTIPAVMGMALTPRGDPRGDGVFVVTVGRVVWIPDADGDGRGDREQVVATGWPAPRVSAGGVSDAMGAAVAPDGSLVFGLGTADFTNAYLPGADGRGTYDPRGERGTIQRLAADFTSRETVCTGIRFPYGLAFDATGQLFCTDQEGATWLANGNPHDELHAIEPGRHYGFPPRHPRHLPDVIDEPSLFDFRPQHQSTCGLLFDEPGPSGRVFGPGWWRGSALVCGESRGRLFRVELAAVPRSGGGSDRIARGTVLGCLATMPVAAALSPRGELVVACHGGAPDWGSGPAGAGSVLRIRHARPDLPQPRFAFTPAPGEVRVVFDRPLRSEWLARTAADSRIDFGSAVSAGDRFEQFRPGYAVVVAQDLDARRPLPIHGVQVSPDGHTLVLATAPHRTAVGHALMLALDPAVFGGDGIVDLAYVPDGSVVEWRAADGSECWSGWLPCLDTALARQLTAGSPDHDRLWHLLERAGTLTLATSLDLSGMLRPEVQPGAVLDAALPREMVTVSLSSPTALWRDDGHAPSPSLALTGPAGPRELVVHATTGPGFALTCRWSTAEDPRPRVLPLHRHRVPWVASPGRGDSSPAAADDLAGASWARGRRLFFGDEAACSRCHRHGGRGGWIGPDLSNLVHRDPRSVRRDIAEPNATLNPEHLAHTLALADGRALTGIVRPDGAGLRVGLLDGTEIRLNADEIEELQPSAVSVMPTGLAEKLGPERLRDLVAFLTRPAPRMPLDAAVAPPPPRSRTEVTALLAGGSPAAAPPRRIVLVAGPKDHGPGEHDYPAWQAAWRELLGVADGVTVDVASPWPSAEQLATADGLVFFQRGEWTPSRAAGLDAFLARGGGAVFIHYAVDGGADPAGFAGRIGLAWEGGRSRFRHGPLDLDFTTAGTHPIARNLDRVALVDESYWDLVGDVQRVRVLATAREEGTARPLFWTADHGRGRVFVSIPGHYSWSFDDPVFRAILLRGLAWATGDGVDRYDELVTLGARIAD